MSYRQTPESFLLPADEWSLESWPCNIYDHWYVAYKMRHFLSFSCGAVTAYIQVSCHSVHADWLLFCLSNRASWVRHVIRYWASQSPAFYDSRLLRLVTCKSSRLILLYYYVEINSKRQLQWPPWCQICKSKIPPPNARKKEVERPKISKVDAFVNSWIRKCWSSNYETLAANLGGIADRAASLTTRQPIKRKRRAIR